MDTQILSRTLSGRLAKGSASTLILDGRSTGPVCALASLPLPRQLPAPPRGLDAASLLTPAVSYYPPQCPCLTNLTADLHGLCRILAVCLTLWLFGRISCGSRNPYRAAQT